MSNGYILGAIPAYDPAIGYWSQTSVCVKIEEKSIDIFRHSFPSMELMDGWVFDLSSIYERLKMVDMEKYVVYDKHSNEFSALSEDQFLNMKEM